ncbi:MAG: UDP-N-acetylmuramoyl-tripeptide--D-alanyl-D-alanine ligase [Anaerovoracaceae bacterium]
MKKLSISEIEKAVEGKLICGEKNFKISGVSTDSRKAGSEDLFFPLIGEIHDAHKFIPSAVENGCKTFVLSNTEYTTNLQGINVILVDDTLVALQKLAKYYVSILNLKKVGVTGSVGKTTTRDMAYYICKEKYKTGTTVGNFNNDIGVPLTVFSFEEDMEAAVVEMGMAYTGDIHRLADIVRPNVGIITNVGLPHVDTVGSIEGILRAKLEITDYFDENNVLVINQGCDMLNADEIQGDFKIIPVGEKADCQFIVSKICDFGEEGIKFILTHQEKDYEIRLFVPGGHNAVNAALAIAACMEIGVSIKEAINGLQKLQLTGKRLNILEKNGIKVIDDTYNACPESVKSGINTLMNTKGKRKIAILGDMYGLGDETDRLHKEVGQYAVMSKVDILIAIGEKGKYIVEGGKPFSPQQQVLYFPDKATLINKIHDILASGDVVLVKASRKMAMEEIVENIVNE